MKSTKLRNLYTEFTKRMYKRLTEKEQECFKGWDDDYQCTDYDCYVRMIDKLIFPEATKRDMVDIANFAMFLYKRKPEED
jgi:hypothetical protein